MSKKLSIFMVLVMMIAALSACSAPADEPAQSEGTEATAPATTDGATETTGTDATSSGDVIKIGVFEPVTGANAGGGALEIEGVKLAHQARGEVLGKKNRTGYCRQQIRQG